MRSDAAGAVGFRVSATPVGLLAEEQTAATRPPGSSRRLSPARVFGSPLRLVLEAADGLPLESPDFGAAGGDAVGHHPNWRFTAPVELGPGETLERIFRFRRRRRGGGLAGAGGRGLARGAGRVSPAAGIELPRPDGGEGGALAHGAAAGGACRDGVLGGHTLDRGRRAASFVRPRRFNGKRRPVPARASRSSARSRTWRCRSAQAHVSGGAVPRRRAALGARRRQEALDGGVPAFGPAAVGALAGGRVHAAATGDLDAFSAAAPFYPVSSAPRAPAARWGRRRWPEHLRRQFRFFVDVVGRGEHGPGDVQMRNTELERHGLSHSRRRASPRHRTGGVGPQLGDGGVGAAGVRRPRRPDRARRRGRRGQRPRRRTAGPRRRGVERLLVPAAPRARGRGRRRRPLAPRCSRGPCSPAPPSPRGRRASSSPRSTSSCAPAQPLGARLKWPVPDEGPDQASRRGDGRRGMGSRWWWPSSGRRARRPAAGAQRMEEVALRLAHGGLPGRVGGASSGPDCYNSPESARPGRTWISRELRAAMQSFP